MEEDLKKKLSDCQKQKEEYLAGWQRSRADFLNYKKEEIERIGELLQYANEEFILKILPILDSLDLAEKKLPDQGFLQIKQQIMALFKNQGVEAIKSLGEKFDPNFHEAVGSETAEGKEPGLIVEELQKGYRINDRLLRPAKVKIRK